MRNLLLGCLGMAACRGVIPITDEPAPLCDIAASAEPVGLAEPVAGGDFSASDVVATVEDPAQVEFIPPNKSKGKARELSATLTGPSEFRQGKLIGPSDLCLTGPGLLFAAEASVETTDGWFVARGPVVVRAKSRDASSVQVDGNLIVEPSPALQAKLDEEAASICVDRSSETELRLELNGLGTTWHEQRGILVMDTCDGSASDVLYELRVADR